MCGRGTRISQNDCGNSATVLQEDWVIVVGHVICCGSCVGTARGLVEAHMALLVQFVGSV